MRQSLTISALLGLVMFSPAFSQTNTTTNCTTIGDNTHCTSTSDNTAEERRRQYEDGQKIGSALGNSMAVAMATRSFNKGLSKYCAIHPGESWERKNNADGRVISSGLCPTDADRVSDAANAFIAKHKDFIRNQHNSEIMAAYMQTRSFDPRDQKSYEKAYVELKKTGKLELYVKLSRAD